MTLDISFVQTWHYSSGRTVKSLQYFKKYKKYQQLEHVMRSTQLYHVETHPLLSSSQRTCSRPASPTSTWALNSKWWSAPGRLPCSALQVAILTRKSPGTRTSCPLTPVQVMVASSSYAQVGKAPDCSSTVTLPSRLSFLSFPQSKPSTC